jgi:hypothetical protein
MTQTVFIVVIPVSDLVDIGLVLEMGHLIDTPSPTSVHFMAFMQLTQK